MKSTEFKTLLERAPEFRDRVAKLSSALQESMAPFDAFDVLANVWFSNYVTFPVENEEADPETYAESWLLSRPSSLKERHTEKDGSAVTRTSSFRTDPATGLLISQVVEPNGSDDEYLSIVLERNTSGQVTAITKTDRLGNVRRDAVVLDRTGIFPALSINAVGHTKAFYYHPGYGVPLFTADENRNVMATTFDGFMRPKQIRYPSGATESFDYYGAVNTASGPSVRRTTSAGTESRTFVDRLGRPKTILNRRNTSGQNYYSYIDIEYDPLGRIKTTSQPYFPDETPILKKYDYDQLDRLTKFTDPAGAVTSREYEVRTIRQTEPNGSKKEAQLDLHGRLVGVTHKVSSPHADMTLKYAPFSLLSNVSMTDPARGTQERVFGYDVLGRQTTNQEPDVGTRTQKYSAYGDVREEIAASGETLVYQLDGLGRPGRIEDKSTGKIESFTWDGSENGLGQVAASTSFDGVVSEYGYSPTSQLAFQQNKMGDVVLPVSMTYDAQDRLDTVSYPGPSPAASVARYFYDDANGELDAVTFAGSLLWKRVVSDAMGRTRREGFANGTLTFTDFNARGDIDSIKTYFSGLPTVQDLEFGYYPDGDLQFRSDHILSTSESFTYDDQRRLHTWSIAGGGTTTWEHDGFGNIKSRVNQGALGLPTVTFNYATSASNKPSSSSLGAVYTFDARGRMTANDVHKSITYTPFDLPNRLEAVKGDVFTMSYDANHQRASKVGPEAKTLYVGRHYERVERPLEPLTHVMHIYGDRALADVVWRDGEPDYELRYLHQDRLGSVEVITDRTGKLIERRKFDPFGAPIDPQRLVPTPFPSPFTAGFTGHSHDPDLSLVNMQGRLFDPTAMRFMTPDPVVSDAENSQAWNPYSYVGQMPFRFTDPTGFFYNVGYAGEFFIDTSEPPSSQQTDSEVPGSRVVEDKPPQPPQTKDDSGGITIADLEKMPVSQSEPFTPMRQRSSLAQSFLSGPTEFSPYRSIGYPDVGIPKSFLQLDDFSPKVFYKLGAAAVIGGVKLLAKEGGEKLATETIEAVSKAATTRGITAADVGLSRATLRALEGTVTNAGTTRILRVENIAGNIPTGEIRGALQRIVGQAGSEGVSTLQIEGRFANEALQRFVTGQAERLGGSVTSSGGIDTITFILGR